MKFLPQGDKDVVHCVWDRVYLSTKKDFLSYSHLAKHLSKAQSIALFAAQECDRAKIWQRKERHRLHKLNFLL